MKKIFSEFYNYTPQELDELWNQSVFIFDTNILLDLYRVSFNTSKTILDIMKKLKSNNQLWLPYQVGFEFHKDRKKIIEMEVNEYNRLTKYFENKFVTDAQNSFTVNCNSHPLINQEHYLEQIKKLGKTISLSIKRTSKKHPDYSQNDPILNEVTETYENCVGTQFMEEKLKATYQEGGGRYSKKTPPGYLDKDKPEPEKYGDLVIWYEMIEKSKELDKPIIFITRDRKEDWWHIQSGEKQGARKELIREMRQKTNQQFYIYEIKNFISIASQKFGISLTQKSKNEIDELKSIDSNIDLNVSESLSSPQADGSLTDIGTNSSDFINTDSSKVKESIQK